MELSWRVPHESTWFITGVCHDQEYSRLGSSPNPDLDAKAMKAIVEAQNLPPGLKRTEALKKADQLCNAADIYRYVFSTELKPPE
jgi:hypothetical protein